MLQKLKNRQAEAGFTLVELLIVIVVIAILAAIVINTFSGVQARARDTERQTDIKAIASQLEVYYTNNGKYPPGATMRSDTVSNVTSILEGLSPDALKDPQGTDANSLTNAAADATGEYGYVTTPAACDNTATNGDCTAFVLTWYSEADSATQTVNSLSN